MMEVAKSAGEDLKSQLEDVREMNEKRRALRDSYEMQRDQLRNLEQDAYDALKKEEEPAGSIVGHMAPPIPPLVDIPLRPEPGDDLVRLQHDLNKSTLGDLRDEVARVKETTDRKRRGRGGLVGGVLISLLALTGLGVILAHAWTPGATTQPVIVALTSTTVPTATTAPTATILATATVPPTATVAPVKPPKLGVTAPQGAVKYGGSDWATIVVKNTGGKPLHWQASAPGSVIPTPASGTLTPNATQTVTLNGQYPSTQSFNVTVTSDGGQAAAAITCS
jgi:hypothetical protein